MSQKLSLDGDVLSLREAEDVGVEGEGCALVVDVHAGRGALEPEGPDAPELLGTPAARA